ncbi:hypothetical protein COY16_02745 [Candidatus Roizmanbacteria bacterium CG_4_10_14_0_2_um_filter_39_13]|uniref:Uncharacterized protein n=1 Tax=Candidatus Roizmanbacteria bacterium CG_4_10_14_0_2_um_filter_39_13 TaxID=1974825 RepID=A0A2M7TZ89_9BACT|nr:MAG: hypothetical protein COY16_02745 [Candidatus Roizmanbacteria bacterium CG_4_10_14_0_2_um_filter_39_13]
MRITIPQFAETFAVEESTHFLAAHGVSGLNPLPSRSPNVAGLIAYHRLPHERDALEQKSAFMMEKYGENPFEPLVNAVNSK